MKFRDRKWREWCKVGYAQAELQPVGSQVRIGGRLGVVKASDLRSCKIEVEFTQKELVVKASDLRSCKKVSDA